MSSKSYLESKTLIYISPLKKSYHGLLRTSYRSILFGVRLLSTHGDAKKGEKI